MLRLTSCLVAVLLATTAHAVVVPVGLNAGDPYHLVFVTQNGHDAVSRNVSVYNQFVNDEAALNPSLTGTDEGVQWFAVATVYLNNARDNAVVGAEEVRDICEHVAGERRRHELLHPGDVIGVDLDVLVAGDGQHGDDRLAE